MHAVSLFGFLSFLITISVPVALIILFIWVYQIKKNIEIQVEQNKEIIELLKRNVIK